MLSGADAVYVKEYPILKKTPKRIYFRKSTRFDDDGFVDRKEIETSDQAHAIVRSGGSRHI